MKKPRTRKPVKKTSEKVQMVASHRKPGKFKKTEVRIPVPKHGMGARSGRMRKNPDGSTDTFWDDGLITHKKE